MWLVLSVAFGQSDATCDDIYQFEAMRWSERVGPDAVSAKAFVASFATPPVSVVPAPDDLLATHPWFWNHLEWRWAINPHPRRPPVRVSSSDPINCPEMVVLPIVGAAESGGGIHLGSRGASDEPQWGADPGGQDLPWRDSTSRIRILASGQVSLSLAIRPTRSEVYAWPDDVDQALAAAVEPLAAVGAHIDRRMLHFGLIQVGSRVAAGLGLHVPVTGESEISIGLPGGFASVAYP